jgi:hypothetical protein
MDSRVLKPSFMRPVKVEDEESAKKRKVVGNKNIARFFVETFAFVYGGRIIRDPWGDGSSFTQAAYNFSPDVVWRENDLDIFTEVKATSTATSQIQCSSKQMANNFYKTLEDLSRGNIKSRIEYAFFKYGGKEKSRRGVNFLSPSNIVDSLAAAEKSLVVVPLNLFFYLSSFAYMSERDQTSSQFHVDRVTYFNIRGGTLTKLLDRSDFRDLNGVHYIPEVLEEFCLDDLEFEKTMTPEINLKYRGNYSMGPFPILRWSIPNEKYGRFADYLMNHHTEIALSLGLRDLFEEAKDIPF